MGLKSLGVFWFSDSSKQSCFLALRAKYYLAGIQLENDQFLGWSFFKHVRIQTRHLQGKRQIGRNDNWSYLYSNWNLTNLTHEDLEDTGGE